MKLRTMGQRIKRWLPFTLNGKPRPLPVETFTQAMGGGAPVAAPSNPIAHLQEQVNDLRARLHEAEAHNVKLDADNHRLSAANEAMLYGLCKIAGMNEGVSDRLLKVHLRTRLDKAISLANETLSDASITYTKGQRDD